MIDMLLLYQQDKPAANMEPIRSTSLEAKDREAGEENVKIKKLKKVNLVRFQVEDISRKILKIMMMIRESESRRDSGIADIEQ